MSTGMRMIKEVKGNEVTVHYDPTLNDPLDLVYSPALDRWGFQLHPAYILASVKVLDLWYNAYLEHEKQWYVKGNVCWLFRMNRDHPYRLTYNICPWENRIRDKLKMARTPHGH